jgi:signal transduction histidine kinase
VIASGTLNPWVIVPNLATLLILGFVAHAGTRAWRAGDRRRAMLVGGSIVLFTLIGGIQAPLVDAAWLHTPYMIGFAFLAIAFALGYELASSTWHSAQLEGQRAVALAEAREARDELERLGRATVLGELTASIAHELNQPLAAILANAQTARRLLQRTELDREEMSAIVEDVIRDDTRALDEHIHAAEIHEAADIDGLRGVGGCLGRRDAGHRGEKLRDPIRLKLLIELFFAYYAGAAQHIDRGFRCFRRRDRDAIELDALRSGHAAANECRGQCRNSPTCRSTRDTPIHTRAPVPNLPY